MPSVQEQVGQVLIVGLDGDCWDRGAEEFLDRTHPGGVIFFRRNISTAPEFRTLAGRVRDVFKTPPFLALDLEGGRVDRLRDALAPLPPVRDAAAAQMGEAMGRLAGRELGAFGLNVDFAPVLDLGSPASRKVLGSRTAGDSPEEVVEFARAFLNGLTATGIVGCGKHFPGLGSGQTDSHQQMPTVEKNERDMWEEDLRPFRELQTMLPMIMVAHAHCPGLEVALAGTGTKPRPLPASLSRGIVSGLLKGRMGYQGLVVCDDLEMGGVLEGRTMEQAAVAALQAGCDTLLLCGPTRNTQRTFDALVRHADSDDEFRTIVERAAEKNLQMKQKLGITTWRTVPPSVDFEALRRDIRAFNDRVQSGNMDSQRRQQAKED